MLPLPRRVATTLVAAGLAGLLAVPALAAADPGDTDTAPTGRVPTLPDAADPPPDGFTRMARDAVGEQDPVPGRADSEDPTARDAGTEVGAGEAVGDATGEEETGADETTDGGDAAEATAADRARTSPQAPEATTEVTCSPVLVTHRRTGSAGDAEAVALTSQAVDTELGGWLHVTWEAAAGTELTAVEVQHLDGSILSMPPSATGTVYDLQAISFCGTATSGSADIPTDAAAQSESPTEEPGTGTVDPAPADASTDADGATATDPDEISPQPPAATTAAPPASPPEPASASDAGEVEVEVLGVQIVRPPETDDPAAPGDDEAEVAEEPTSAPAPTAASQLATVEPSSSGPSPLLIAAAVAAGLIAGAAVLRGPAISPVRGSTPADPTQTTSSATPGLAAEASGTTDTSGHGSPSAPGTTHQGGPA